MAPAARVLPQVLVWAKSPLVAMLLMARGAVPVLANSTDWAALVVPTTWLPNVNFVGDKLTAAGMPVPLKGTTGNWKPEIMSVIASTPLRVPVVVGAKVTAIVQFEPGAKPAPQVLVCAKSPVRAMLGVITEGPLSVRVML